jgi:head-tail adaptor
VARVRAFKRNALVTFLNPPMSRDRSYNTPTGEWLPIAPPQWAEVRDVPLTRASMSERVAETLDLSTRVSSVKLLWRGDITPTMRVWIGEGTTARTCTIVAGPNEIGRRDGIELIVAEMSSLGVQV